MTKANQLDCKLYHVTIILITNGWPENMFFGYLNKVGGEAVLLEHIPLIQQKEFWPWVRAAALSNC